LEDMRNKIDLDELDEETIELGLKLFSIFSNFDTLRLFLHARKGIKNSKKVMEELNLTPKRYYTRLKELTKIGILEKNDGIYRYTPLGKILYQLGYYFLNILQNKNYLTLLENLLKLNLSEIEREKIFEVFSDRFIGLTLVLRSWDKDTKIEKIYNFNDLVEKLVNDIESSKDSIFLASRYLDLKVIEACIRAIKRGIKFMGITSGENFKKLRDLSIFITPKLLKILLKILSQNTIIELVREIDVPYSFCIIDHKYCYFEFPQIKNEFTIAFRIIDEDIGKKFENLFFDLWNKGSRIKLLDIFNV